MTNLDLTRVRRFISHNRASGRNETANVLLQCVLEIERLREAWDGIFGERDHANAVQWVADLLHNQRSTAEPFVVKHYAADERPTIKGNGFDGLEVGGDREDAEDFVKWLNERLGVNRGETP